MCGLIIHDWTTIRSGNILRKLLERVLFVHSWVMSDVKYLRGLPEPAVQGSILMTYIIYIVLSRLCGKCRLRSCLSRATWYVIRRTRFYIVLVTLPVPVNMWGIRTDTASMLKWPAWEDGIFGVRVAWIVLQRGGLYEMSRRICLRNQQYLQTFSYLSCRNSSLTRTRPRRATPLPATSAMSSLPQLPVPMAPGSGLYLERERKNDSCPDTICHQGIKNKGHLRLDVSEGESRSLASSIIQKLLSLIHSFSTAHMSWLINRPSEEWRTWKIS